MVEMVEKCKVVEHYMSEDEFEEDLTELFGDVCVGHICWGAGHVLRELDPIAFDQGIADGMGYLCTTLNVVYDDYDDAVEACKEYNEEMGLED